MRLLIEHGAHVGDQDSLKDTALIKASQRGEVAIVELLIEAGADVHVRGFFERSPLQAAAEEGNVETLACLLKHGAGKNRDNLNSALFSAAARGPTEAVRLLLEHGADPNSARIFPAGYTPLLWAAYSESNGADVFELMLESGADPKAKAANGDTPLSLARKRGHTRVVDLLEKAGAVE